MNQIIELKEQTRKDVIAERAQKIVDEKIVSKAGPNHWRVQSSDPNHPGLMYDCFFDITLDILTCSCPHYQHRAEYCKHLLAVAMWVGENGV